MIKNCYVSQTCQTSLWKAAQLCVASSIALTAAPMVQAQSGDEQRQINLPAAPLGETLVELGEVLGVSIIAPDSVIAGKTAPEISGPFTAEDAMSAVLAGSGLSVTRSSAGVYVVNKRPQFKSSNARQTSNITESIIVKGKFQQSLIDRIPIDPLKLPFSLDVINRDFIDERNNIRPIDALINLPSVEIINDEAGLGSPLFIVRGFEAPVLVNNRVQTGFRGGGLRDDSFIDRYEVLRGPASIALGPIDGGGVINTVTKSPEDDQFFSVELTTDQFGTFSGEFDVNAGSILGDGVIKARFSGAYRNFQFDAAETKREIVALRPVFEFNPTNRTSALLSVGYVSINAIPNIGTAVLNNGTIPEAFDTSTYFGFDNADQLDRDVFVEGQLRHEFLDNLRLTIRGSHQDTERDYKNVGGFYNYEYDDGLPGISPNNQVGYLFSLTAQSEGENNFIDAQLAADFELFGQQQDIVIGGSYIQSDFMFFRELPFSVTPIISVFDVALPQIGLEEFNPPTLRVARDQDIKSFYAEFAVRPNDWLTVIGGVRHDRLDLVDFFEPLPEETVLNVSDTTFRIGASAEIFDGINTYISYAEAFTPQVGQVRGSGAIGPETSGSFEIGVKGLLVDGRVRFNAAIYSTKRKNVSVDDPSNTPPERFSIPVGRQRNRGFEISADIAPLPGLNLNLNYGYVDIDILEGPDGIFGLSVADHTASAFGTYEFQSGYFETLKIGGGFRLVGKRPTQISGLNFESYTVVDALVAYPLKENISVSANIINVFDKLYLESAGRFNGDLGGLSNFGAPRTAVVTLRASF